MESRKWTQTPWTESLQGRKKTMVGSQWWAARYGVPRFSLKWCVFFLMWFNSSVLKISIKRLPTSWTGRKVFVCSALVDMTRHFSTRHEGVFLDSRGGPPVPLRYLCSDVNTMGLILVIKWCVYYTHYTYTPIWHMLYTSIYIYM